MNYTKIKNRLVTSYKEDVIPFFYQLFGVLEVIFYTTLPTIILILFSIIDKKLSIGETLSCCYIHGEFLLYSIALLSSAYTTMKVYEMKKISFVIILIIVVSILYAITIKTQPSNLDVRSLFWVSIIASVFSFGFTWHAMSLKKNHNNSFQDRDKNATDKIENGLIFEE